MVFYVSPSERLTLQDLKEVREALFGVRAKWRDIGIQLNLPLGALDAIKEETSDTKNCLTSMCVSWLKEIDPCPSWRALIEALESEIIGEKLLAQELRNKYYQRREAIYQTPGPLLPGTFPTSQGR